MISMTKLIGLRVDEETEEARAGVTTANFLVKQKIDILLTKELGEAPFHILRDNFIDIFKLNNLVER